MANLGVVELGGTKTLVATGSGPNDLSHPTRINTVDPESTFAEVLAVLRAEPVEAVGIASFGPLELRRESGQFGYITVTPKPGWSDTNVLGMIQDALGIPTAIDTDVNGAALGEGAWGAARGLGDFVYLTIGTGIGGGAVVGGRTIAGLGHPEMGHIAVTPATGDDYPGRCPYHGGCLEGMASGPALADRFGPWESRRDQAAAGELAAGYIAQGVRNIIYMLAPQRVIIGGGVSKIPDFHLKVRAALKDQLGGYPAISEYSEDDFVVAPGLENPALAGAMILAENASG